jgi:hypothetical protein
MSRKFPEYPLNEAGCIGVAQGTHKPVAGGLSHDKPTKLVSGSHSHEIRGPKHARMLR